MFAPRNCQSDTNIQLDMSLPPLGCSNWKNNYSYLIYGFFDERITVHCHFHCDYSSAALLSSHYSHYPPGLVSLSAITIGMSPMATGARVLVFIAAAAVLGPATGIFISAATAAWRLSRTVAGAAARWGSICHSVRCMLLHQQNVF